jgi:hypothetical protein
MDGTVDAYQGVRLQRVCGNCGHCGRGLVIIAPVTDGKRGRSFRIDRPVLLGTLSPGRVPGARAADVASWLARAFRRTRIGRRAGILGTWLVELAWPSLSRRPRHRYQLGIVDRTAKARACSADRKLV